MDEQRPDEAISEDLDPGREGEPREPYPDPTQKSMDEELRERRGWETEDSPHEGEEGQAEEPA